MSGSTIILSAGGIDLSHLPVGSNTSNAMIPVNGKPVIGWILDDLLRKSIRQAIVVVRDEDRRLQEYLKRAYEVRMSLTVAPVGPGSILTSLQEGLRHAGSGPVRLVLGDTLIRDPFDPDDDLVYAGPVRNPRRWCLVETDAEGYATSYIDKTGTSEGGLGLAGYYRFSDLEQIRACVSDAIGVGARELSAVLTRYGRARPLKVREVQEWFDFGHIDHLVDSRRRLLGARFFNSLSVDPVLSTITKVSPEVERLRDEVDWFHALPGDLNVLGPRILHAGETADGFEVTQEYYGYPTLAELYVYGELHADAWQAILRRVMSIHDVLRAHPGDATVEDARAVYLGKTTERLEALRSQPSCADLIDAAEISLNGRVVRGLSSLWPQVEDLCERLASTMRPTVIHGDLCFSNILFDLSTQVARLIDPRGRFGRKGISGDPRYDVAKLRHSVSGLYDFVVGDLFDVRGSDGTYETQVFAAEGTDEIASAFDRMVVEDGYNLDEIRAIEGLLFLSMPPLHADHPARQRMMFLTGLRLLDEALR